MSDSTDPRVQRAHDLLDQQEGMRSCWPGAAVDVIAELAGYVVELADGRSDGRCVRAWFLLREVWSWAIQEGNDRDNYGAMKPDMAQQIRAILGDDPYGTTAPKTSTPKGTITLDFNDCHTSIDGWLKDQLLRQAWRHPGGPA